MFLLTAVSGLFGGAGGAAAAGAGAATTAAAGTGFSISSVLQGLATVGGVVASIAAGNAEAENLKMQARDVEAEKPLETLRSVERKRSLLKAAAEAVGEEDAAYAASGADLSFGTAAQARQSVYRQTDLGLNTDSATTEMKINRLTEKSRNLRLMAKRAKSLGLLNAFSGGLGNAASLAEQY